MFRRGRSLILGLAGCGLAACQPPATFTDTDRAAIEDVLRAQADAWNRGDLEGFMAGYERSDALVFTSGANIRRGFDETFKKYHARYGRGADSNMGHLAFHILDIRELSPTSAMVLGRWELTRTPEAGRGVFSLAFVETPDGWKVVHDHTSAETGPPS